MKNRSNCIETKVYPLKDKTHTLYWVFQLYDNFSSCKRSTGGHAKPTIVKGPRPKKRGSFLCLDERVTD